MPDLTVPLVGGIGRSSQRWSAKRQDQEVSSYCSCKKSDMTHCFLAQTMFALKAGATAEEILEIPSVVVAMSGTTGIAESLGIIRLLEEPRKL